MLQNKRAESVEERGKGNLDRKRRTDLDTVEDYYDFVNNGRRCDNGTETMSWNIVALREYEKMNEVFPPRPRLSGMDLGK
jgi:hypothetical protein